MNDRFQHHIIVAPTKQIASLRTSPPYCSQGIDKAGLLDDDVTTSATYSTWYQKCGSPAGHLLPDQSPVYSRQLPVLLPRSPANRPFIHSGQTTIFTETTDRIVSSRKATLLSQRINRSRPPTNRTSGKPACSPAGRRWWACRQPACVGKKKTRVVSCGKADTTCQCIRSYHTHTI